MTTDERIDALIDAQNHLEEALALIKAAVAGHPCESNVDAYALAALRDLIGSENCNPHNQAIGDIAEAIDPDSRWGE